MEPSRVENDLRRTFVFTNISRQASDLDATVFIHCGNLMSAIRGVKWRTVWE